MKVLAALCVGLTAVRYGANVAITSGMIYEFEKDSDEYLKMTMKEASWLRKKVHQFTYRVTHQVVTNLLLTSKQKFRFGLVCQNFCFDVNGRFATT